MEDCEGMVQKSIEELGGLDIIISNAVSLRLLGFDDGVKVDEILVITKLPGLDETLLFW